MSRNVTALRHFHCLVAALAFSLIGACASGNPFAVNREYLDKSYNEIGRAHV